eukprot:TRINITY_DN14860_c0_g1_i1.p1 TRINITY_DN14860_c0_g1~~TRINITY_DN14860_c0_g1_i1.p1  ORF type:complete len:335 (+),score=59.82 TRINITY_DN14860_c0_g1_i1:75-1079(+)
MKAVVVTTRDGPFTQENREIPTPKKGQVLLKVQACGICQGDLHAKAGHHPRASFPRVVGHEVAGVIEKVGEDVASWKPGQKVGVGWHGGHCFNCDKCRRGGYIFCDKGGITGMTHDGGYAQYMIAPAETLIAIPEGLTPEQAAPLMCAGVTMFNSLRNSGARPGDLVAIQGIGGLGHLGIQYANKFGYVTVAISSGESKRELSLKLGAHYYLDASKQNVAQELKKLGGAKIILTTAPNSDAVSALIDGLGLDGKLLITGVDHKPLHVTPLQLLSNRASMQAWPSGGPTDVEDTLKFSALFKVYPMIEVFPIEEVQKAYDKMLDNSVRFRSVLKF